LVKSNERIFLVALKKGQPGRDCPLEREEEGGRRTSSLREMGPIFFNIGP
jgi:hypothetical protein